MHHIEQEACGQRKGLLQSSVLTQATQCDMTPVSSSNMHATSFFLLASYLS